jgi:primosomal protein N' (replication factor Y)
MPGMSRSCRIADVLLPLRVDHPYSYLIRDEQDVNVGAVVRVPLGPRTETGVVWQVREAVPDRALKPLGEVLDLPPMNAEQRRFVEWMARYYVAERGLALRLFLPLRNLPLSRRERLAWRTGERPPGKMTPQRRRVLDLAAEGPPLTARELAQLAGVSESVVRGLIKAGALLPVALPKDPPFEAPVPAPPAGFRLNSEQEEAARALREAVAARGFSVSLLDGVTGSGKTEVYFEAMAAALAAGRQVLLMLPEIALTGPFIRRVSERFSARPAEWHSDLSPAERARVFRAVAGGEARIVVAARSGLFLPWKNLGLIVVDEEHETAYKQESGVPYHGRDMAVVRAALGDFPVVLASATPSLESLVNAERGRYRHLRLTRRHGTAPMPEMALVDLRENPPERGRWISPPVAAAVSEALERGEQALLFLNRRGYAPLTLCRACGHRLQCPHCTAWLVQHRLRGRLVCHHCGYETHLPATCPHCEAEDRLAAVGPGVERLAEEAAERWPGARIAVLSTDLQRGARLKQTLAAIADGQYDIIVGTQLVAKGHHFPKLTFAGVIDGDLALETVDPRAGERTWQLLTQVAGRAGRAGRKGRALLQTHMTDHPLMQAIAAGDRDAFLAHEKAMRRAAGMPPFGRLAALIVSSPRPERAREFCLEIARRRPAAPEALVLGPAPAPIAMVRGRHRFRFLVKTPRDFDLQAFLRAWLDGLKVPGNIRLEVDVDPYSFL